jgi:hypothetical protein
VSTNWRFAAGSQISRQELTRSAYVLAVIFFGTLITGVLATLAYSASGCFLSRAIRCFSISRDALGLSLLGLKVWSLPAFIAALLTVMVVQVRGSAVWWNALIVAPVSMLGGGVLLHVAYSEMILILCVTSLVLFVGIQLSRLINNWFGRYSI